MADSNVGVLLNKTEHTSMDVKCFSFQFILLNMHNYFRCLFNNYTCIFVIRNDKEQTFFSLRNRINKPFLIIIVFRSNSDLRDQRNAISQLSHVLHDLLFNLILFVKIYIFKHKIRDLFLALIAL